MAITIQASLATELRATRETESVVIPWSITNAEIHEALGIRTATLFNGPSGDDLQYAAFPATTSYLIAGRIIGVYSDGPSHGDSDRAPMFRIDNPASFGRANIRQVNFRMSGSPVFDTSLLDDIVGLGERHVIKKFLITGTASGVTVSLLPPITHEGRTYAPWSRPKQLSDGNWYRCGYQSNTSNSQAVFLMSADDRVTWSVVGVIASDPARRFSEADFVVIGPGKLVALVREDSIGGRPLFQTESDDFGRTWSTAFQHDPKLLGGTQPNANTLADGTHFWMFGDRSGSSGSSNLGMPRPFGDCTGITAVRMRTGTILSGAYSNGFGTLITDGNHNVAPGNIVVTRGGTPGGWNGTFIAQKNTAASNLVVKMADPGGPLSGGGNLIAWGWLRQVATFVGTDGGQPAALEIAPGKIVAPFYGVRRHLERPRIQFLQLDVGDERVKRPPL